jgi:uncharacterized protein YjbI with pentapeptide repeats
MEIDLINKRMWQNAELQDLNFESKELAKQLCLFNSRLVNLEFKDCYFEELDLRYAKLDNVRFVNCKFAKLDMNKFTEVKNSLFKDCELTCYKTLLDINISENNNIENTSSKYWDDKQNKLIDFNLNEVLK